MSQLETCPECKTGKLRPEEGDIDALDFVCDNASCRHKVSRAVTKKDDSNESPSDG